MLKIFSVLAVAPVLLISACSNSSSVETPTSSQTPVTESQAPVAYNGERPSTDGFPAKVAGFDHDSVPQPVPKPEYVSDYGNPDSYEVFGKTYEVSDTSKGYKQRGMASWYGTKFHGRRTSSGEPYDMFAMTAASKSLPIPTYVKVKNLDNGKEIIVRVNDRGPFHEGRIIDLSYTAAAKLGVLDKGTAPVEVTALAPYQFLDNEEIAVAEGPDAKDLYVQAGAFSDKSNAERLTQQIKTLTQSPVAIQTDNNKIPAVYRVQIGPLANTADQKKLISSLQTVGVNNPVAYADEAKIN